jgi:hypothetical protein
MTGNSWSRRPPIYLGREPWTPPSFGAKSAGPRHRKPLKHITQLSSRKNLHVLMGSMHYVCTPIYGPDPIGDSSCRDCGCAGPVCLPREHRMRRTRNNRKASAFSYARRSGSCLVAAG